MKFVIHKGVSGFADRLQSLMSVIKYSVKTNRILVVDWTDSDWCNDQKYDFYHYFHFKDLKNMSLKDFKSLYSIFSENNVDLTVKPKIWNKDLFSNYAPYSKKFYLFENNGIIENISNGEIPDYTQDVIIYVSRGYRTWEYMYFDKHIRFNSFLVEKICNNKFYKNIISNNIEYTCVHFRLGDRQTPEVCAVDNKSSNKM